MNNWIPSFILVLMVIGALVFIVMSYGCVKQLPLQPVIADKIIYDGSVEDFKDPFFTALWIKTLADYSIVQSIEAPKIVGLGDTGKGCNSNAVSCNGIATPVCYMVNEMKIKIPCATKVQYVEHMYKHYIEHWINLDPDPTHISSLFTDGVIIQSDVE